MKRMHVHISVDDLQQSINFYQVLFANEPDKVEADYARWKLSDPAVTFAISTRGTQRGIDHLGIQVDEEDELTAMRAQLAKGEIATFAEGETTCCYAQSDKSWIQDPAGVPWEVYRSMQDASVYHDRTSADESACCVPQSANNQCCG